MPDSSLLDRLRDRPLSGGAAPRHDAGLSLRDYRAAVVRDLENLLNATPLPRTLPRRRARGSPADKPEEAALESFPLVRQSVLNYGLEDWSGLRITEQRVNDLARGMQRAIAAFEPRLNEVRVRLLTAEDVKGDTEKKDLAHKRECGLLAFLVEGVLHAESAPVALRLRAELDTRTGHHHVAVPRGL